MLYTETRDDAGKTKQIQTHNSGVHLLTIHGSKGLEYDVVFLLKCADKMMYQEQYD